ncbi:MAG TPA: ABC transporter permease [Thermoanaerobaculia bacterium]|nr:ABC transporter permease [Thermoanaerobaculia bacterium]
MRRIVAGVVAAAAAIAVLAFCGLALGHAPAELLRVAIRGSVGSPFALQGTIVKSIPLLLTGLSVAVAFRAGVWNIGAEGQFIVGALAAFVAAPWGLTAALIVSIAAGAVWASIATALRFWRGAPEVLTTILLNFVGLHLLGWAVNGPLQERIAQYPQTDPIPSSAALPRFGLTSLHAGIVIAVVVCIALWIFLERTTEGLRMRATGFNASAAQWAGVNVTLQIAGAMAISGGVAGLAGGIELLGVTHRLFELFAAGYGYSGIAVALLAQLHPIGTLVSALFFGALQTAAGELQRSANISITVATFGQAVVILTIIGFGSFRARD